MSIKSCIFRGITSFEALTACHEIDGFQNLQRSDLTHSDVAIELHRSFRGVASHAPDEVRPRVHQSPQQVVESRVKILSQRRNWLVAVQSAEKVKSLCFFFQTFIGLDVRPFEARFLEFEFRRKKRWWVLKKMLREFLGHVFTLKSWKQIFYELFYVWKTLYMEVAIL